MFTFAQFTFMSTIFDFKMAALVMDIFLLIFAAILHTDFTSTPKYAFLSAENTAAPFFHD